MRIIVIVQWYVELSPLQAAEEQNRWQNLPERAPGGRREQAISLTPIKASGSPRRQLKPFHVCKLAKKSTESAVVPSVVSLETVSFCLTT